MNVKKIKTGNRGGACAVAILDTSAGHVAELCQDHNDARRRRYGLPAGSPVLQRPGLADGHRGDSRRQWPDGIHSDDMRRVGKTESGKEDCQRHFRA